MTGREGSAAREDVEQGWLSAVGPRWGPEKAGVAMGRASCDHGSDPFPPRRGAMLWPGAGSQECGVLSPLHPVGIPSHTAAAA